MGNMSKAMRDALAKIGQPGGHGYGKYAYLGRRTAEALARRGLVILGTREIMEGKRILWAILAGAEAPYGFRSHAEETAALEEMAARARANVRRRQRALMAAIRERAGDANDPQWRAAAAKAMRAARQDITILRGLENGLAERAS